MAAILFGSISTLADTSERQREAFNSAFSAHGLDWHWDRDEYLAMLERSGGVDRIAEQASSRGESVDAEAVHRTKSELFRQGLADTPPDPRPGVVETVRAAHDDGLQVALVTTTSEANVTALLDALRPHLGDDAFDLVVDATDVDRLKPDPEAYSYALERLHERASGCVAIEDNLGGTEAAVAAGVECVAFPNANTAGHDFTRARLRVDHLDPAELRAVIPGA